MDPKDILQADDMALTYSGWNQHVAPRGPFVFHIFTHTKPALHSFPSKDKQLSKEMVSELQDATKRFYQEVSNVKTETPCKTATVLHSSYTATLQEKPNLIYISNSLPLTNEMPCLVYRPTLNEM